MSFHIAHGLKMRSKKMNTGGIARKEQASGYGALPSHCAACGQVMMAHGGAVEEQKSGYEYMPKEKKAHIFEHSIPNQHDHEDMISAIMNKRKKYSEGGRVANETPIRADFEENEFDDLVKDDDLDGANYTGANSGDELGNSKLDGDDEDLVLKIMRSRKKRDRMPSPV